MTLASVTVAGPGWFTSSILDPGMAWLATLAGPKLDSPAVRQLMLTIALQESGMAARTQLGGGPAHGFWQFEQGGGVAGVLHHQLTQKLVLKACVAAIVAPDPLSCWRAIEGHDGLAVTFARLLLLTDPNPVPTHSDDGWLTYVALWRPGRPRRATWAPNWARAMSGAV